MSSIKKAQPHIKICKQVKTKSIKIQMLFAVKFRVFLTYRREQKILFYVVLVLPLRILYIDYCYNVSCVTIKVKEGRIVCLN